MPLSNYWQESRTQQAIIRANCPEIEPRRFRVFGILNIQSTDGQGVRGTGLPVDTTVEAFSPEDAADKVARGIVANWGAEVQYFGWLNNGPDVE